MSKTDFEVHMKHLKLLVKWNCCWHVCTTSLNFEICFLTSPWEIVFGVISGNYLHLKLLENAKRTNILTNILEEAFCPIKTEIGQFPLGFCPNYYCRTNYWLDLNKEILFLVCTWRHHALKSKTKEPPKFLSSSGIRRGKFISVDNFSAQ